MSQPWTAIDWSAERPNEQRIQRSHGELRYAPIEVDGEATQRLLAELRRVLTNGDAFLAGFQVEGDDEVCHWFASRNRFDEYGFFHHVLTSSALRVAVPDLIAGGVATWVAEPGAFEQVFGGVYTLDGWLGRMLMAGGAYGHFAGTAAQAKELGAGASRELVGDRFDEFVVYTNHQPWSAWFGGVAWDTTVLAVDLSRRQLFLLAMTDSD